MQELTLVRGDSRCIRIGLCSGTETVFLGGGDYGIFRIYDSDGRTVVYKRLDSLDQELSGRIVILLEPEDTMGICSQETALLPGDIVPLRWELELHIGEQVISPVVAGAVSVIIDQITLGAQ